MSSKIEVEKLIGRNPGINRERLEAARDMHRQLQDRGLQRKGYDLASPFITPGIAVREDKSPQRRLGNFTQFEDAD